MRSEERKKRHLLESESVDGALSRSLAMWQ